MSAADFGFLPVPMTVVITPRPNKRPRHSLGFTLMEMLVVTVILLILGAFGFPALQQLLNRSKLQGSAREIAVHLGSSRITALRMGRNVVVKPMFAEKRLVSFLDDNENFVQDLGEEEVSSLSLVGLGGDRGIFLMGPDGVAGTDDAPGQALEGLTTIVSGDPDVPDLNVAVFEPDGSIRDSGGIRISDGQDPANLFEVRIDPPATARVEILKYVYGDDRGFTRAGDPATGSWFGQGGNVWEWY